ncbi:MAG: hypothetical protein QG646_4387 [Euryarchaeota archaeon]|nr:hypothetical protein [Euryarchaeota archaeon]
MINIDKTLKKICFQNDYEIGKEAIKTHECDLLSAYICPKCEQILLAYFKTDEFIPVWKYDEKEKDRSYDSESGRRYYRYRVFYAGCGIMGMELKEHNGYNGCPYEIQQCYSLISFVNSIFRKIEEKLNGIKENSKVNIALIPDDFDKQRLAENIKRIDSAALIPDICNLMDPLIKFDIGSIKYDEINIYDFEYGSPERKKAELQNFESMKKAYEDFLRNLRQ